MDSKAKYVAKVGILAAAAAIVMLLEFPLSFVAPPFYKLNFSECVVLIGGFSLGPLAAVLVELLKNLLNLLINGTSTGGVGELGNFLIGCSFVVPAAFIYKYRQSKNGAIAAMGVGTLSQAVIGGVINYFVLVPVYAQVYVGGDIGTIIGMGTAIFPWIDNLFDLVLFCTVPFNIIKGVLSSLICYILYKRLSPILHI